MFRPLKENPLTGRNTAAAFLFYAETTKETITRGQRIPRGRIIFLQNPKFTGPESVLDSSIAGDGLKSKGGGSTAWPAGNGLFLTVCKPRFADTGDRGGQTGTQEAEKEDKRIPEFCGCAPDARRLQSNGLLGRRPCHQGQQARRGGKVCSLWKKIMNPIFGREKSATPEAPVRSEEYGRFQPIFWPDASWELRSVPFFYFLTFPLILREAKINIIKEQI